ncbi:GntR family transcriptional regulator [Nonomuraea sp. NPDC047897]|uniref:GntR family transcriptional regulator n=1 Tax=Nonomuraea sp. NPDC047897 TaxID=3364346 RepID=UPI00371B3C8C
MDAARNTINASPSSPTEEDPPVPVVRYPEVLADLRTKILDGTYLAGEPLPHTQALKETYDVGAHVITRAMKELKEEGLIWRVANRGMIVQPHPVAIEIALAIERRDEPTAWAAACRRAGAAGRLTLHATREEAASEEVAQGLCLDPGSPVVTWELHGDVGGQLVCLDQTYVSKELHDAVAFDVERSSGVVDVHTRIRPARREEASKLKVSRGSPLLDVTRITYDDGRPLHLLRRVANPQRIHISDKRLPLTSP